ncbi:MAG: nuclear transport factor 2 family protein [Steroidobacteraceae bacterium]
MSMRFHLSATAMLLMIVPMVAAAETPQERTNIRNVEAFYDAAINAKDINAARAYIGDRYIQHNPTAPDGIKGLEGFVKFLRTKFPRSHSDIVQAFADGHYVILHVHSVRVPGTRGRAIVDIFRLDDHGKVVEHWDVIQDVPEKSANANTMF